MGDRENIIVLQKEDKIECWGSLVELCSQHAELSYNYLKRKKFPFKSKEYEFKKIPFRFKTIY